MESSLTLKAKPTSAGNPAGRVDRQSKLRLWLSLVGELGRVRLVAAVTLSAAMGYILFVQRLDWGLLLPVLGVFFLGSGCSALNQIQEYKIDARMARTRNRPLPSGQIDRAAAWFVALVYLFAGLYVLASINQHTMVILILGLFSLFWYNIAYTYLKRITFLAVIPGAVLGAIPPVIGWCAAGGVWSDGTILMIALYFFIWQIPHFWLLMLMRGREYEQAGLRSITQVFSREQLGRILFVWITATAIVGFLTACFTGTYYPWRLAILLSSVWLVVKSLFLLQSAEQREHWRPAFLRCIMYNVLFMLFMALDALLSG